MINGEILLLPKQERGYYNNIKNMNKKIFGLSIIEALVATVIVGIGFVAVLQMTSFAVTSIDTSGERTKANYIVSMIAEDIIGHRDSNTLTGNKLADELVGEGGFNGDITNCKPRAIVGGNADVNVDAGGEVSTIYGKVGKIISNTNIKIFSYNQVKFKCNTQILRMWYIKTTTNTAKLCCHMYDVDVAFN